MNNTDTIAAISTAPGESAVSVIRISGENAFPLTEKFFTKKSGKEFNISKMKTHTIHFGNFSDIDEVLVSVFKSPNSFTGENIIEISCHGGSFTAQKVLQLLMKSGIRHAEPGEFTKRAFLNGKMDLSQAEAVADLIKAKTDLAHNSSLKQLEGSLSNFVKGHRSDLINLISLIELELDFAEEDVEFVKKDELRNKIINLRDRIQNITDTYISGKLIREGIKLVIAGKPNSGKSSLFNALLDSERAIVSSTPGTTRDYIEENLIIKGVIYNLIDTAGLRFSVDEIESEGIKRSYDKLKEAEMILFLIDSAETNNFINDNIKFAKNNFDPAKAILCFTKIDLKENFEFKNDLFSSLNISVIQPQTLNKLRDEMSSKFTFTIPQINKDEIVITNFRHKTCLEAVIESLDKAAKSIDEKMSGEFISLDLRNAISRLGEITGEFTNEEVLNSIFSKFCIGK